MRPCFLVDCNTPKGYKLQGFWFGPRRAKRVIILVHGLGGSAFGGLESELSKLLVDAQTAVLAFNNRGYGVINKVYKDAPRTKKGYRRIFAGAAHEVFEDCVDDIDGAIACARKAGAREIFLAGHSTGCQKSVFWAAKRGTRVRGIMLFAPMSDYAYAVKADARKLKAAQKIARAFVRRGKKHALLPQDVWPRVEDAQRFLSLYTPDSREEIFSYAQPKKNPLILKQVGIPLLVLLAELDEYRDRPTKDIASWFEKYLKQGDRIISISGVMHSFKKGEKRVAKEIKTWIRAQK